MIEVQVTLQFNNYSLGNRRGGRVWTMLKDANGKVMFMPSWWKAVMRHAARIFSRHHDAVTRIDWDPVIAGTPRPYKRFYKPQCFQRHEAFHPGDTVTVNAVLPDDLPLLDFTQLLDIAGCYCGISPYQTNNDKYGTFAVVNVQRRVRTTAEERKEANTDECAGLM